MEDTIYFTSMQFIDVNVMHVGEIDIHGIKISLEIVWSIGNIHIWS